MTRIHISSGPQRRKPKAGDEKVVKGLTMIRQQVLIRGMGFQVSNGRPVFEWVVKGSADDRSAHRKPRGGEHDPS